MYIFFLCRYFSYVADLLEDDCTVHHAPWSGDGGSLDTSYLLKCLPMFLSSSVYEPVNYDAIIFNSGLHDINCCGFPREVKRNSKSFLTNYVNYNNYSWRRFDKRVPRVSISRWFRFTERELLVPPWLLVIGARVTIVTQTISFMNYLVNNGFTLQLL